MKYHRILKRLGDVQSAVKSFRTTFGPVSLSDKECIEILSPQIQQMPEYRDKFARLSYLGAPLTDLCLNICLGTQGAHATSELLHSFAVSRAFDGMILKTAEYRKMHDSASILGLTLAAVQVKDGDFAAQAVARHIMGGANGLVNMYVYQLAQYP